MKTDLAALSEFAENSTCRLLSTDGGWYAVLEVPRNQPEEELVLDLLLRDNVIVHPGYFFDFEREAFLILSLLQSRRCSMKESNGYRKGFLSSAHLASGGAFGVR